MSWLRHDEGDDAGDGHGYENRQASLSALQHQHPSNPDTLATRLREVEALLASERESHSQCREALSVSRLNEKEALYRAGIESSNAGKAADAFQCKESEYRSLLLTLENTQTVLKETQGRLAAMKNGSGSSTSTCVSCTEKDTTYTRLQDKYKKLESDNATLTTAKKGVEGQLLTLVNQHAALERSSQRDLTLLRDQIDALNDEIEYLRNRTRSASEESEVQSAKALAEKAEEEVEKAKITVQELEIAIAEKEESHRLALRGEVEKCEVMQEELLELERSNERLRIELARRDDERKQLSTQDHDQLHTLAQQQEGENNQQQQQVIIDSLNSQIRSLEIAFQDSNSSLLSSRSALVHTESRLGELERLLGVLKGEQQREQQGQGDSSSTLSMSMSCAQGEEVLDAQNAFTDEYVLNLRAELEDEIKLRVETESRAETLEARIEQLLSERNIAKEAIEGEKSARDSEDEALRLDIEKRALTRSQRALTTSEAERHSLLAEIESLTSRLSETRSLVLLSERKIQDLESELITMTAILEKRNEVIQMMRAEKEEYEKRTEELEDGELKREIEMQSLKRDAKALRDQLMLIQQQTQVFKESPGSTMTMTRAATPETSPRRTKHTRANSAPFCPSPLRTTSYPPSDFSYKFNSSSSSEAEENAFHSPLPASTGPTFPSAAALDRNESEEDAKEGTSSIEERAIVLVARLRQERDQALQRLEYHLCENKVGMESLMEEMGALGVEKERLEEELRAVQVELARISDEEELGTEIASTTPTSSSMETDGKTTTAPSGADIQESAQQQEQQREAQLVSLTAQISSLTSSLEDRQAVISTLLSERDSLVDELSHARLSLKGAQNLSLSLQDDLDRVNDEFEAYKQTSSLEFEEMKDEMEQSRTYLVGAQNLVLELEKEKKAVLGSLESVRGEMLNERIGINELEVKGEAAVKGLVLALLSARKAAKASCARSKDQEARLLEAQRENTRLQNELATALSQQQEDAAAVELVYAAEEQQEQINQLIVLLIESSRRSGTLATQVVDTEVALSALKEQVTLRDAAMQVVQADLRDLNKARDLALSEALAAQQHGHEEQLASLREEMVSTSTRHTSTLDALGTELAASQQLAQAQNERVRLLEAEVEQANMTVDQLRDALRLAEEEGKNLVQDFNLLSEEFEKRQIEDETRTLHTETQERKLEEAMALQADLMRKSEEAATELLDSRSRIEELTAALEAKQLEIEETDDRYLISLKTIKKQTLSLDKLKVRIEALQRANALLTSAVPKDIPSVLAPAPASAKKRGLPKEFVHPDPGPTGVDAGPGMQTLAAAAGGAAGNGASHQQVAGKRSAEDMKAGQTPSLPRQKSESAHEDKTVPVKAGLSSSNESARSAKVPAETNPVITPNTALASSRPRRPLAVVQPQASQPLAPKPPISAGDLKSAADRKIAPAPAHKLGSFASSTTTRQAFKPTSAGAQANQGVPSANNTRRSGNSTSKAGGGTSDTKSLLAALQALKRPA